jgi:hypothetical protein
MSREIELYAGRGAAVLPLVGEVQSNGDASEPFVDPFLRVALLLVELLHPAHRQFGVLDLVKAFLPQACQPALEWFDLGAGDRLDEAEDAFRVPALEFLRPAGSREFEGKGGANCPPLGEPCSNPVLCGRRDRRQVFS